MRLPPANKFHAGCRSHLRASEDATARARQIEAVRYSLVHAGWFEDPDAVQPGEWLTLAASEEQVHRAYRRLGARFEVDQEGEPTMRLSLDFSGEALQNERLPCLEDLRRH